MDSAFLKWGVSGLKEDSEQPQHLCCQLFYIHPMATGQKLLCDRCHVVSECDGDTGHDCPRCGRESLNPVEHRVDESISAGTELTVEQAQAYLAH